MASKKRITKAKAPNKKVLKNEKPRDSFWMNTRILSAIIFAFSFLLYANTLGHKYAVDDAIVIYDNMFTTQGVEGIPGILSKDTFFGFFKDENKAKLVSGGRYRPMTLVLFAIERQIFGDSPFIGHLMNIVYYGLSGILIFLLFRLLLYERMDVKASTIVAFIAALLFVAHPVHTEAVANIKGRDEIFCLLGCLFSLYLIFKNINNLGFKTLGLVFLCFFIGLMSKENAITYLGVAPLVYIYFYPKSSIGNFGKAWLTLLVASVVFIGIRSMILGFDMGGSSSELMNNPFLKLSAGSYIPFSFGEKFATIIFTLGKYIQLLAFPHPLIHDYYPREVDIMTLADPKVLLSIGAYISLLIFALLGFKKRSIVGFGIIYFLMTISIVSNVVFPVGTNMSERFLYMPSVGFVLIVSYLLYKHLGEKKVIYYSIIGILLVGFSIKTVTRNMAWKDDFTLFNNDVKISDKSAKLLNAAGGSLVTEASKLDDGPQKTKMLNEAVGHLNKAIQVHPTYKNPFLLLGNAKFYLKDFDGAINTFQEVLKIYPGYSEAVENLGITYRDAGRYYGEEVGDLNKAISYLTKAYPLRSKEYETLRLLGVAMGIKGNIKEAVRYFQEATIVAPKNAEAFVNLGNAYMNYGDEENGRISFQKAVELDPNALNSKK